MNMLRYCLILGAVITTYGQRIEFSASPTGGIHFPVTEQLVLRCSLNDTVSLDIKTGTPQSTRKNVSLVTSIVVTRNGNHVASVSQYAPANAFTSQSNLQVTGKVNGLTPEDCYLEMIWALPNQSQAGSYICEINAVDEFYHNVVFTKLLNVHFSALSMKQVSDYILADRKSIEELRDSLVKTQRALQTMNSSLIQTQRTLQTTNSGLTQAQRRLQSMHTQTGFAKCGGSRNWSSRRNTKYKRVTIRFARPYVIVPKVTAGMSEMDVSNAFNTRIGIKVTKVTKTDFTVECYVWSSTIVYGASFDWISTD